jgi:hypothetical protein
MKCINHNDRETEIVCSVCGKPVCGECGVTVNGRVTCRDCAYNMQQYNAGQHRSPETLRDNGLNGFLFFIFLAVPGLRHMYMGLMRRGLHFLTAFFGSITIAALLGGRLGTVLVPVIFIVWFYSAFDSYQMHRLSQKGEKVEDVPLFKDRVSQAIWDYFSSRRYITGVIVILLGVYLLLRQIVSSRHMFYIPDYVIGYINLVFDSMIPLLFIIGGIYLMVKAKKIKPSSEE